MRILNYLYNVGPIVQEYWRKPTINFEETYSPEVNSSIVSYLIKCNTT